MTGLDLTDRDKTASAAVEPAAEKMDEQALDPATFESEIIAAWDAFILTHGKETKVPEDADRRDATEWFAKSDAARLHQYWSTVKPKEFKRHVTYQLYYLTELAIWLYKRMPIQFLSLTNEESVARQKKSARGGRGRLPAPGAGQSAEDLLKQRVERLAESINDSGGNELPVPRLVQAMSHDPPPPPPGWPPQP